MAESEPGKEQQSAPAEKPKKLKPDSEVGFTFTQLGWAAGVIVMAAFSLMGIIIANYHQVNNRLDNLDTTTTELNKKLGESAISSERFHKLEVDLKALQKSNDELRSKVFK